MTSKNSKSPTHAFDYLDKPDKWPPADVCVVFGDERFLKCLVLERLRQRVLGGDDDVPFTSLDGDSAEWRDVADELSTASLFGSGRRLVVVDRADKFVSEYRSKLEDYVARPSRAGTLVLDVGGFPGNTRLAKAVAKTGLAVECKLPTRGKSRVDETKLARWLGDWAAARHEIRLDAGAAEVLVDLVGPQLGLLDQELAKLALYVEKGQSVAADLIQKVAGGWRVQTAWELLDAATAGNAPEALRLLDRLLKAGQHPVALMGAIRWSLSRYAAAAQIFLQQEGRGQRPNWEQILAEAGFKPYPHGALDSAKKQLGQLGRDRGRKLYRWLLDADLALKGSHSQPARARMVLELLIIRLSRQARSIACS